MPVLPACGGHDAEDVSVHVPAHTYNAARFIFRHWFQNVVQKASPRSAARRNPAQVKPRTPIRLSASPRRL